MVFSASVNTTVFIAAVSDSEQLGNSVYANEASAADGAGELNPCLLGMIKITSRINGQFFSLPQMTPPGYYCREMKIILMPVM